MCALVDEDLPLPVGVEMAQVMSTWHRRLERGEDWGLVADWAYALYLEGTHTTATRAIALLRQEKVVRQLYEAFHNLNDSSDHAGEDTETVGRDEMEDLRAAFYGMAHEKE